MDVLKLKALRKRKVDTEMEVRRYSSFGNFCLDGLADKVAKAITARDEYLAAEAEYIKEHPTVEVVPPESNTLDGHRHRPDIYGRIGQ